MNLSQLNNDQFGLLFDVRRSIRYHDRRRSFFELMHRITSFLTILMAGSVLFEIGRTDQTASWLIVLSVIAALISAADMVIGYANKADLHRSLKVRFIELEKLITLGGSTDEEWNTYKVSRLQIEQDEPPIYRVLDILCHIEICKSLGIIESNLPKIGLFKSLTRHIWSWPDIKHSNN